MIEIHEAADLFPLDEEGFADLAKDIADNGQQVPIELCGGKVIDGRRRLRACELAGVKPKFRDVNPSDPVAYVLSLNLHRRHLTPGQRAMVGARATKLMERLKEEAKERQRSHAGTAPGKRKTVVENLPQVTDSGKTRDQIGKALNVSGKTIDHAKKVLENAIPEVVRAVDEGRMAVSTAAILSTEPEEKQREEATNPKRNRTYNGGKLPAEVAAESEEPETGRELKGVGIFKAREAIDCLSRIPKNDALRNRGFQLVTDWLKRNQ